MMTVPKPYYEQDGITIYHGDCREILPHLPKVDLVLTDPPYGNNYSTGWRAAVRRPATRIKLDREVLTEPLLNDTAEMLEPLLNDTAAIYCFAAPDRLDMVLPILKRWDVVNVIAWDKGNCTAGDLECSYGKQWEALVFARKGRVPLIGGRDRDVIRIPRMAGTSYVHPTQKPVELKRYLIGRHEPELILDPFMGSGTTLRAAKDLGRSAIGIELDERYCEVAAKRLAQGVLFGSGGAA